MARAVVVVHVEQVDVDLGLWCAPCALSTGVRVWFTTTISGAGTSLRSTELCIECGSQDVTDA